MGDPPTTGLYSTTGITYGTATNGNRNTLVLKADNFETLSIVPGTTNGDTKANDIVLGNGNFESSGNYPEYGPALIFGGTTGQNSDPISLQRYNIVSNQTALLLSLSDDFGAAYGSSYGDAFFIGATGGTQGAAYHPAFQFTTDGQMWIANTAVPAGSASFVASHGATLHFGSINLTGESIGSTAENTDDMFMQRWDISADHTALLVNIGDNYGSTFAATGGGNGGGDAFIIGAQDSGNSNDYHSLFTFTSDGKLLIGDVDSGGFKNAPPEPNATLDVRGEVQVGVTGTQPADSNGNLTNGLVCSATTLGALRYNPTTNAMEYCTQTAAATNSSPATYAWTALGAPSSNQAFGMTCTFSQTACPTSSDWCNFTIYFNSSQKDTPGDTTCTGVPLTGSTTALSYTPVVMCQPGSLADDGWGHPMSCIITGTNPESFNVEIYGGSDNSWNYGYGLKTLYFSVVSSTTASSVPTPHAGKCPLSPSNANQCASGTASGGQTTTNSCSTGIPSPGPQTGYYYTWMCDGTGGSTTNDGPCEYCEPGYGSR